MHRHSHTSARTYNDTLTHRLTHAAGKLTKILGKVNDRAAGAVEKASAVMDSVRESFGDFERDTAEREKAEEAAGFVKVCVCVFVRVCVCACVRE